MSLRPVLKTFRVLANRGENRSDSSGEPWQIQLENAIDIGLAVPTVAGSPIQAWVKMHLKAQARSNQNSQATASFEGEYQGSFNYPDAATEAEVAALVATDEHQYLLAAQVFPLAMTHFQRELQATGFDARELPLGL
jgi:hypothetical protein